MRRALGGLRVVIAMSYVEVVVTGRRAVPLADLGSWSTHGNG